MLQRDEPKQERLYVRKERSAGFSELSLPAHVLTQSDSNPLFQASDGVADGGLASAQVQSSRTKPAALNDGLQRLPFVECCVHGGSISKLSNQMVKKMTHFTQFLHV